MSRTGSATDLNSSVPTAVDASKGVNTCNQKDTQPLLSELGVNSQVLIAIEAMCIIIYGSEMCTASVSECWVT